MQNYYLINLAKNHYLVKCLANPKKTASHINPLIRKNKKPTHPNRLSQAMVLFLGLESEFTDTTFELLIILFEILTFKLYAKLMFMFLVQLWFCY